MAALLAACALLTTVAALAPSTGTAQLPTACRGALCTASLSVGTTTVAWQSPETFYPNNERVYASPSAGLRQLTLRSSFGPGRCKHRFRGAGLSVILKACGTQTPLRVRAVRLKSGSTALRLSYTAEMLLGDAPEDPPQGVSGLLKPITAIPVFKAKKRRK